jgi:hypothetical protein
MVLFGSLLDQFVIFFSCQLECAFNIRIQCRLIIYPLTFHLNKDFDQQIQWIRDIPFVFNLWESKIKIYAGVDGDICVKWNSLLELGCFAGSMVGPMILLFLHCFFWRPGLLESWCWIQLYGWGHWFGCSLHPGTLLYSTWTLDSSALLWLLTLPIKEQKRYLLQDEWLTTFYLSPLATQNPCLYTTWY